MGRAIEGEKAFDRSGASVHLVNGING